MKPQKREVDSKQAQALTYLTPRGSSYLVIMYKKVLTVRDAVRACSDKVPVTFFTGLPLESKCIICRLTYRASSFQQNLCINA